MALVSIFAACAGEDPSETAPEAANLLDAAMTVEAFFAAVSSEDYAATAPLVDESQLAVLTAIEGVSAGDVASMIASGVPAEVRSDFWGGFADAVPSLVDQTLERATVGEASDLGGGFQAVAMGFPGSTDPVSWIVRSEGDGWVIDMFATFGPAFAPNLDDWVASLPEGSARDIITDAIVDGRASFEMGVGAEPLGPLSEPARAGVESLLERLDG